MLAVAVSAIIFVYGGIIDRTSAMFAYSCRNSWPLSKYKDLTSQHIKQSNYCKLTISPHSELHQLSLPRDFLGTQLTATLAANAIRLALTLG